MGGTKRQKHCAYVKPHPSHTWKTLKHEGVWCPGTAQTAENQHTHIWDAGVVKVGKMDDDLEDLVPVNGAVECPCGKSAWLKDGRKVRSLAPKEARFPQADAYDRTMTLKTKLDKSGPEALSEDDKAELKAIADALVVAFEPMVKAFQKMAEQVMEYLQSFMDRLDPETVRELHRLAQAYGEPTERPAETIELRDALTGEVIAHEEPIVWNGFTPLAADRHAATEIVEDSEQAHGEFMPVSDGEMVSGMTGPLTLPPVDPAALDISKSLTSTKIENKDITYSTMSIAKAAQRMTRRGSV